MKTFDTLSQTMTYLQSKVILMISIYVRNTLNVMC
ncbi:hypothetical protein SAMN05216293_3623 [Flagellimonas taeanensis]|uniref:Uncharacterized protein n=1 Tax=Flagellimonas taeanensis TaxID=1005926 RepID=A0A1M7B8M1_9FLAO|nr:hypothetical protein SAMN05216293_3623 [Allomuricauda taeanensis]